MKEQFATFSISKKLKELGFNEACMGFYNIKNKQLCISKYSHSNIVKINEWFIDAPLWQQAIDWLREKQNAFACPIFDQISGKGYWCTFGIMGKSCDSEWDFDTYEDARKYAILKAIELCK